MLDTHRKVRQSVIAKTDMRSIKGKVLECQVTKVTYRHMSPIYTCLFCQTDLRGQAQMRLRCQLGAGLTLPPAAPRCREQVARESEYESERSSTLINNRCGEAVVKGDICEL